jgi:DNA-binding protein
VFALQAKVTQAWEAAVATESTHVMVVLTAETSAQVAIVARGRAINLIKDAMDWAALVEREAQERVSRVEAESAAALAYAQDEAENLVRKITLLEDELAEACQAQEV